MSFPAPSAQPPDPSTSPPPDPSTPPPPSTPPTKRGWPTLAKVLVAVLAVTTVGAVVAGVVMTSSAKSDTTDVEDELDSTQDELDGVQDELESTQGDLERAEADLAAAQQEARTAQEQLATSQTDLETAQADLTTAQADLAASQAETAAVRSLFPVGIADLAAAPLQGNYALALVGQGECTGYADNASACSAENLPDGIAILGDPAFGYTVSSAFFADTPLLEDAGRFTASGTVLETVADLCDGQVSTTSFTLAITVAEVSLTSTDTLEPSLLFVDFFMVTDAAAGCSGTSRDVDFDGTRA